MVNRIERLAGPQAMMKWSSRPAVDKTARVRDNQRRHRERVKSYISDLESRLSETQMQLDEALSKVEQLSAELSRIGAQGGKDLPVAGPLMATSGLEISDSEQAPAATSSLKVSLASDSNSYTFIQSAQCFAAHSDLQQACKSSTKKSKTQQQEKAIHNSSALHYDTPPSDFAKAIETGTKESHTYPVAKAGESTMLCRDAYSIILEQNYGGLDESTMLTRLRPGFRRSSTEGSGCRVESGILFACLDHLNPL